jgi:hypothetical protein
VRRRRFEADHGLRLVLRADARDVITYLSDAPGVAGGPHLIEEARRGQLRIRRQSIANDRAIRIELRPPPRLRRSHDRRTRHHFRGGSAVYPLDRSIELAGLDPMVSHSATDAEAIRDVGLVETFIQEMLEQDEGVPSEHDARLRRTDVECEEGQCVARFPPRALLKGCSPRVQFCSVFLSKITPVLTNVARLSVVASRTS